MKKTLLVSFSTLSILLAAPQAVMLQGQGIQQIKKNQGAQTVRHTRMKKRMHSPFLIKHGLPHLTRTVMQNWDNPAFALTSEQKHQLMDVRKTTMGTLMKVKPAVIALRKEIIREATAGTKADELEKKVDKLASMEAEATMVQLRCIEKTKEILTKNQLFFLLSNKGKGYRHGMKSGMVQRGKGTGAGERKMKCGSGKCGGK